ncbi:MAG TPA: hypothetical protein VFI27_04295 [candidate division Zixibacteria bacterium]|nr:hypothetical protein [candidate division Zixibacteria bacterium]
MTDNHKPAETEPVPDDLLEIRGEDIDQQEVMATVADRVTKRRSDIGFSQVRFPSYDGVPFPGLPVNTRYDPDLYHHLRLANTSYFEVQTEPELEPSPATRIPLIGQFWGLIRLQAHNLVLFYVNRAVRHEVDVNRHMISVLNSLAIANQGQQEEIEALKSEVKVLRSQQES